MQQLTRGDEAGAFDEHATSEPSDSDKRQSAAQLWQSVLGHVQLQVTRPIYDTYLRDTVGVRYNGGRLSVAAPSDFATEWLSLKLRPLIMQTLAQITGSSMQVTFEVIGAPGPVTGTPQQILYVNGRHDAPDEAPSHSIYHDSDRSSGSVRYVPPRLNERYTFETFVEGDNNRLALAACVGAAEHPGATYNPVFLYGGVGLGKTHLLHAMGHALLNRGMRVIYVTSEQFTNDFVGSIRERHSDEFRARYRNADLLLIDDIQFIAGKEQTMEEFFHTFNDLHSHGRQIVITSDQPPKKVNGLQDRLISRFEWGLIADIQPPSPEMRLAILQEKARLLGRHIPEDVLSFISDRIRENVRELEGSLNRVVAYADLTGAEITLELAWKALGEYPSAQRRRNVTPEDILDAVAGYFQLRPAQLGGPARDKHLAHARQIAMYLLHEDGQRPLTEIGRILGKRDHTTVMYGCKKIEAARVIDPDLRRHIQEIRDSLAQGRS